MRIVLKKLRWQNFMSYGNLFSEIDFQKTNTTLIVGKNGSGKTTWIDALCFVLYKKPFRKINLPQLTNSIIGKNTVVELEFSIGTKEYLVIRGLYPDIFEIYRNGELIKKPVKILEYQEILQKIIKINHKSFCQIVVLGTTNFVPFLSLETYKRREIIENLLDIQIFSTMNTLIRSRIDDNEKCVKEIEHQIKLEEQKQKLYRKHIQDLKQNHEELIQIKQQHIENLQKINEEIQLKINELNNSLNEEKGKIKQKSSLEKKINDIKNIEKQLKTKTNKILKDIQFYTQNDNCPTCTQTIEQSFKENKILSKQKSVKELSDGLVKLTDEFLLSQNELNDILNIETIINDLESQLTKNKNELLSNNTLIKNHQKEIENLKNTSNKISINENELNEILNNLANLIKSKGTLIEQKSLQDVIIYLLKDTGIKSRIIKQYVPLINKFINKYLASMDFFVNFEIDENFNEIIKSRHRDSFSYESFSEGEKKKIDLAILFTWRSIAKLRNSISINLLALDEIFDSSLDGEGTEKLIEIIKNYDPDANIFMISHRENMVDVFDRVIKMNKVKNFSEMITE